MEVAGARNRKTWNECVEDDMKVLGLHAEMDLQGYVDCRGTVCWNPFSIRKLLQ